MTRPTPATEFFDALQSLILDGAQRGTAPQRAATLVWCTACGGSGEGHSAYADHCCNACDGTGKRPANWRELVR